ncbi:MAG TPA: hypothetical protein RMH99_24655 [Sandaracinaceae bacterium LLY-WYZ-13_1]|nr:hypothetical protein [Sandaracinaceae bacterium LLY-WYZ-13_1]
MKATRRWTLRLLAVGVMVASLTGPSPGSVGGCGQEPPTADAAQFCTDRRFWECRRENVFGRISDEEFSACVEPIERECAGATWSSGCRPTQQAADTCISLLRDPEFGPIPTDELKAMRGECTLCGE